MRGFPNRFNTRQDVDNAFAVDPEQTAGRLQMMIDHRHNWHITAALADTETGVTDSTHRVREDTDESGAVVERYQEEWREDPHATLFRLGLTVAEAKQMIQEATA
ncbi:hypothetical protein [Guyparkeria halopsychrophila]|uniref:hypothetical protein n=1 Tax=Guyparkeria halopsychrophila TaxID=3139421 RepID=UPI0037C8BF2A